MAADPRSTSVKDPPTDQAHESQQHHSAAKAELGPEDALEGEIAVSAKAGVLRGRLERLLRSDMTVEPP